MSRILAAFDRQKATIRRIVAKYRSNPDDIEELTQETFLKGFAAELETEIHEPEHLLLRIAKNLAIQAAQKKAVNMMDSIEDSGGVSVFQDEAQGDQEQALDARRKLYVLSRALGSLDPDLRRALVMRRIEGLKYKQIATRLNVSVSTIEKRVAAAMVDCRIYLREHGFDPAEFGAESRLRSKTRGARGLSRGAGGESGDE